MLPAARAPAQSLTQKFARDSVRQWAAQPMGGVASERSTQKLRTLGATTESFLRQTAQGAPQSAPSNTAQLPPLDTPLTAPQQTLPPKPQSSQSRSFTTTASPSLAPAVPANVHKPAAKDPRQVLIDGSPLTPVDELVVAAHMARLSNICYVPEPQEQLEELGLKLVAKGKTYFTAWYIADGPDLSKVQEKAPLGSVGAHALSGQVREGEGSEGGARSGDGSAERGQNPGRRIRYILTHGVRWGAADLDSGRMWHQIMNCWPVDFPPPTTPNRSATSSEGLKSSAGSPPQEGLVAHQGVLEIAEEVYSGVQPWLGGVEKGEVSAIRFGGHSLGGSVAILLMLLAKSRHVLAPGQVSAHAYGAPAALARRSVAEKKGRAAHSSRAPPRSSTNGAPAFVPSPASEADQNGHSPKTVNGFSLRDSSAGHSLENTRHCPVLHEIGLPADAVRSIVLDKDMVPRMFLAADPSYGLLLKSPLVRGLLDLRERVWGPGALTQERFLFANVGLVHYIKTVGSEVLVRTLTSEQANEGLRLTVDDFVRQPLDAVKALFDHHRGHYSQDLEAAAAAAKYRSRQQQKSGTH
ncbi:hypothetical protein KFL_003230190 [Klebsormidium nitens]|uniref:Fungal lipase-type domain-containing protein n=1 Tax=Klebsormidium nitens TaxID=105231 RepID=A0A1Y1I7M6_KLENI|nr:hypothetical protein KFL_003230190 [Klebsormidium nitens]|eukprot:GAQ86974.1 hypothetical protein KFL_003230190 [Klebsormidium nitens]